MCVCVHLGNMSACEFVCVTECACVCVCVCMCVYVCGCTCACMFTCACVSVYECAFVYGSTHCMNEIVTLGVTSVEFKFYLFKTFKHG